MKLISIAALALSLTCVVAARAPQTMPANDLHKVRGMLREGYETVKKYYFDATYRGVDIDARFKEYDEKIKTAPTLNAGVTVVAAFMDSFKDSHTFFIPPARPYHVDYGYRLDVVGDDVFVQRVKPGTDADGKVKPGDRIVSINGSGVGRESFHRMEYLLNTLQPQPATTVVVRDPAGVERTAQVQTQVVQGKLVRDLFAGGGSEIQDMEREQEAADHLMRQRHVERDGVMIWKMPAFSMENSETDQLFGIARKQQALILDLRGNPGGLIDTLRRSVANLFDTDITISQVSTRNGGNAVQAKSRGKDAFAGKLFVLVDAGSASSAEMLARVVQLEHRGVVLGDRTAGAVMEARQYPFAQGETTIIFYGFSVTMADVFMKDGKSLEGGGVQPDEKLLPTGLDLASGRDPVMARAATLAGLTMDALEAGKLFPFEWK